MLSPPCHFFHIEITGQVQGVGFRPYIYQLACEFNLIGTVYNHGQGVSVFIKTTNAICNKFSETIKKRLPPLARIDSLSSTPLAKNQLATSKLFSSAEPEKSFTLNELNSFIIANSQQGRIDTQIASDAATCAACVNELLNKGDRRFRYPFINCTHCGPRYSIIEKLPYDRAATTMKDFPLCRRCEHEYHSPTDRRFHAQPNACPDCGPKLTLWQTGEQAELNLVEHSDFSGLDEITTTVNLLKEGNIVAIKGLGGYHLVCDANNQQAVSRLRDKKQRKTKPLSLMMASLEALDTIVELSTFAKEQLTDTSAPIVLTNKKNTPQSNKLNLIAPNMNSLGVMLPYTPLHHLLFQQQDSHGNFHLDQSLCLVMTSANLRGAPLIYQEQELAQLAQLCDYILSHNRVIARRIDDSIINCTHTTDAEEQAIIIRRARGMAPKAITFSDDASKNFPSTLALGGFLKNSICLTKGNKAYLSQYIGDLDNPDNCRYLQATVQDLMAMLNIIPEQVACDLHPDFYSSQFAQQFAAQHNIALVSVQHHHAHSAAIACEQQLQAPYFALSLDGVGLGDDGKAWGGECLYISQGSSNRLGYFSPIALPGGDIAAKQPWRSACAFLLKHNLVELAEQKFSQQQGFELVKQMISAQMNCPTTSSAGRLFDLAAALLGISNSNSFEAEAAMQLESAATSGQAVIDEKLFTLSGDDSAANAPMQIDFSPLLLKLSTMQPSDGAATFHQQLALGLTQWLSSIAKTAKLATCKNIVLSGGCFLNTRLTAQVKNLLSEQGFKVFTASEVSPNDSSLALGQAWVAIEQFQQRQLKNNSKQQGDEVCA